MNAVGPVIRARYLQTEEYLLAAWDRNPKKSKIWIALLIGAILIASLMIFLPNSNQHAQGDWRMDLALILFFAILIAWSSPFGQRWQFRKSIRKQLKTPPTEVWFEFSQDGFMNTGHGGRSTFDPWTTLAKIVQMTDGLIVYVDEVTFFWIPQHAFASAEDYRTVVKLAQTKVKLFQQATR